MKKTRSINYRTRRRLITTSIVIKSLVAIFLLFGFFYIIANLETLRLYYAIIMSMVYPSSEVTVQNINQLFITAYISIPVIIIVFFVSIGYNLFWGIKSKPVFFRKQKQIVVLQFISCLSFLIMPISGIFMLIASYMKDDGLPPKISKRKQRKLSQANSDKKPQKPKLSKPAKKQIKELKSQKRKGIISEEKFNKQVAKIKKNDNANNNKK